MKEIKHASQKLKTLITWHLGYPGCVLPLDMYCGAAKVLGGTGHVGENRNNPVEGDQIMAGNGADCAADESKVVMPRQPIVPITRLPVSDCRFLRGNCYRIYWRYVGLFPWATTYLAYT